MMDSLFEKWDNDGCGYLDLEDVETVMQKYKEGQENEAILRGMSVNCQGHWWRMEPRYFIFPYMYLWSKT